MFNAIGSATLRSAIDALLGAGNWKMPRDWGQVLFTFPSTDAWTLPHRLWHVDYDYTLAVTPLPTVQAFACVGDVQPRGAATLVVTGSHHLVARFVADRPVTDDETNAGAREAFNAGSRWWSELTSVPKGGHDERRARFMDEATDHDGIGLRVVEMAGARGDIALVHPWLVHCAAPNATSTPRLVRHTRFNRQPDRTR